MEELDEIEEKLYDQGDYEYAEQRLIELNNEHPGDSRIILDYKLCECFKTKGTIDYQTVISTYQEFVSQFDNSELKEAARTMVSEFIIRGVRFKNNVYMELLNNNLSITLEEEDKWIGLFNCIYSLSKILMFLIKEHNASNFDINLRDTIFRGYYYTTKEELLFVKLPQEEYEMMQSNNKKFEELLEKLGIELD